MKGLELSKDFYFEIGEPTLKRDFSDLLPFVAAALVGSGSECFGYDDELSRDHDFAPSFCIFVPDDMPREQVFLLERAYSKLPSEYGGFSRPREVTESGRRGVIRTGDFYEAKTGRRDGALSLDEWLSVPSHSLSEAVNGEVFIDNHGEFSKIRKSLSRYPEDIKRKKLAGTLFLMSQAGLYNYPRCIARGDTAAAQMAVFEFVKAALESVFLLSDRYMPYYKWCFRALSELPEFSALSPSLEYLLSSGNSRGETDKKNAAVQAVFETVAAVVKKQNPVIGECDKENLPFAVNDSVGDNLIRNMHILAGI